MVKFFGTGPSSLKQGCGVDWRSNFWNPLGIVGLRNVLRSKTGLDVAGDADEEGWERFRRWWWGAVEEEWVGDGWVGIKGVKRAFPGFSLGRLDWTSFPLRSFPITPNFQPRQSLANARTTYTHVHSYIHVNCCETRVGSVRVAKSSPGRVTRVVYRAASRSYREGNFFSSTNAYADGEEIEFIRNTRPWECTAARLQNSSRGNDRSVL